MSEDIPQPDPSLTPEEELKVARLSIEDIKIIDKALLSQACDRWRKVAAIVSFCMHDLEDRVFGIPDIYYAQRVRKLVDKGLLESQGKLGYMRFSEVRLPKK